MSFCPKCRYEYKAGVTTCPDCEVELVASLPDPEPEGGVRYDNWVQLARLTSAEYAEMIRGRLEDMGIPVTILSGAGHFGVTGQMGPSSSVPIGGGFSVAVPDEFVVQADAEGEAMFGEDWVNYRLVDIDEEDDRD